MKVGDRVKVIDYGSGFSREKVGNEYIVIGIVENGYVGETGILLEGYMNSIAEGRVSISCLKVIQTSEPNYEIY